VTRIEKEKQKRAQNHATVRATSTRNELVKRRVDVPVKGVDAVGRKSDIVSKRQSARKEIETKSFVVTASGIVFL